MDSGGEIILRDRGIRGNSQQRLESPAAMQLLKINCEFIRFNRQHVGQSRALQLETTDFERWVQKSGQALLPFFLTAVLVPPVFSSLPVPSRRLSGLPSDRLRSFIPFIKLCLMPCFLKRTQNSIHQT